MDVVYPLERGSRPVQRTWGTFLIYRSTLFSKKPATLCKRAGLQVFGRCLYGQKNLSSRPKDQATKVTGKTNYIPGALLSP